MLSYWKKEDRLLCLHNNSLYCQNKEEPKKVTLCPNSLLLVRLNKTDMTAALLRYCPPMTAAL
jgi:hypothetical protein